MTFYTHPDLPGVFGASAFVLRGRQFPSSWWRTASQIEIENEGFVVYEPPIEPDPEPSTDPVDYPLLPWQFKAMVMFLDVDADIRAAIMQIPDAMQRAATMSRYENSTEYRYEDPLVEPLRSAVGMPEAELIDAWMIAKDLRSSA